MDMIIEPHKLCGTARINPSKSQAHRLLICAALADRPTEIICAQTSNDISATVACLNALGAKITQTSQGYRVIPIESVPKSAILNCGESGSTLRFMLPITGALGVNGEFYMTGRLPDRPLSPLKEEMERMGCQLTYPERNILRCSGQLHAGAYRIDGSVSSQFISGLLFALVLLDEQSSLQISGKVESAPYVELTRDALSQFGAHIYGDNISPSLPLRSPGILTVEGDWSNAAFFFAANTLGSAVQLEGLCDDSVQGDRICKDILMRDDTWNIDAADIPDLVPILSVAAAAKKGGKFTGVRRLRLKESDRIASTVAMLSAFGIHSEADDDSLTVYPGQFQGCIIDSQKDHRIAMAAAIGATIANGPVTILNAECVSKSYPAFWDVYKSLGGKYEQHIR